MKNFSWLLTVLFVVAACAPAGTPTPDPGTDKLAAVLASGVLIVATDPAYPPQSELLEDVARDANSKCAQNQYTASQFTGFDADLAKEVARRLGVEPCFVTPPWGQLVAGNWANHWDVSIGSMSITHERMSVLYFSQPYFATPSVFVIHEDNTSFKRVEDLSGKRIGVCAGCTFESYLKKNVEIPGQEIVYRVENPVIVAYENEDPALHDLAEGDGVKLDALMTQQQVYLAALREGLPLKMLGEPVMYGYACIAIDKKNTLDPVPFLNHLTEIIQAMHKDGSMTALSIQYHGIDLSEAAGKYDINAIRQVP